MLREEQVGEGTNALDLRLLLSAIASGKKRRALMVCADKRREDRLFQSQPILVDRAYGMEKGECEQAAIAHRPDIGTAHPSRRAAADARARRETPDGSRPTENQGVQTRKGQENSILV